EVEHALANVLADLMHVLVGGVRGQRVEVGDQEEAVVLAAVLQLEVFLEGADVVAEVVLAGWPQASQQPLASRHGAVFPRFGHWWVAPRCEMKKSLRPSTRDERLQSR